MEFRDKFIRLLREHRLRPVDVCKHTEASKGSVSQWTGGVTRPGNRFLPALAELLECDASWLMDDLLGWEDRGPPVTLDSWEAIKSHLDTLPRKDALKLAARIDMYLEERLDQK
ncbi:MAG: hypothetical protein C9356_20130 [Oleiphilus sp.]|nr:MAG: hypothetical protein C9356_20130 [Oleiphilus sp.]